VTEPRVSRPYIADDYGIPKHLDGTLPWSWAEERLREAPVYWVASVRPSGRPHVTPIWAVWVDGAIWMEGGAQTRRFKNMSGNPAVVVTIERGNDAVIVEGDADLVTELDDALVERLLAAYKKYVPTHGYEAQRSNWDAGIWRVRPHKVLGWSKFPADTTRWTFADEAIGA
jgi:nitroimidazol reductase NimA-like FMN-containing flavoprotein (pyridoxamine 5'-phosphate oxidase superfamily)